MERRGRYTPASRGGGKNDLSSSTFTTRRSKEAQKKNVGQRTENHNVQKGEGKRYKENRNSSRKQETPPTTRHKRAGGQNDDQIVKAKEKKDRSSLR